MGKTIKADMKAKKAAVKRRLAKKKAAIKSRIAVALLAALFGVGLSGCALERADPAARSNRATYTITVTAHGEGSTAYATISDGLMATADGEGAVTQPATLTTTQNPELAVPGDALSAGIQAAGHVAGKAIDAFAASAGGAARPAGESCPDGDCSE